MSWGARHTGTAVADLRERIVAAIRDGSSMRGAAARFSVKPIIGDQVDGAVSSDRERGAGALRWAPSAGVGAHEDLLRALVAERSGRTSP
jgi:hypothetical protein